ncbi:MAG TPA: hypothetical protein VK453_05705 [Micromonosporaceae bacterium]|nr:hypothetical protein [Micromonosporaceae bacterium]
MLFSLTPLALPDDTDLSAVQVVGAILGLLLIAAAIRAMFGRKR